MHEVNIFKPFTNTHMRYLLSNDVDFAVFVLFVCLISDKYESLFAFALQTSFVFDNLDCASSAVSGE